MTGADTTVGERADRPAERSGGRTAVAVGALVVAVVVLFALAVSTGSVVIPLGRTLSALLGALLFALLQPWLPGASDRARIERVEA